MLEVIELPCCIGIGWPALASAWLFEYKEDAFSLRLFVYPKAIFV
jgi:hypothetical protein